ncbi:MAG: sporulation protein YunB [Oscillospiraceae bacterium]|nr:sporulation protein YunB [Oscillospiraceae bacterium]
MHRYWRYRRPRIGRTRMQGSRRLLCLLLVGAIITVGAGVILDRRASPQIHALAETLARQQAAEAIAFAVQQALAQQEITYDRLVLTTISHDGIRTMQTNAHEVNLLRGQINSAVERSVEQRRGRIRIPLGALLGSDLLAGRGPNIGIPLRMAGSAISDIRSDFTTAGLNQSMHRVMMDLEVTISVILPGAAETFTVEMTVALAETVIVGHVPGGVLVGS